MKTKNNIFNFRATLMLVLAVIPCILFAQVTKDGNIYIHPEFGNNANTGSKENPIKSLYEAAKRVNEANGKGAINIYLSEGIYGLDATVTFHPANWHFTKEPRLTIRAASLPDDADWSPAKMPVIISTMPLNFKPGGEEDRGTSYMGFKSR